MSFQRETDTNHEPSGVKQCPVLLCEARMTERMIKYVGSGEIEIEVGPDGGTRVMSFRERRQGEAGRGGGLSGLSWACGSCSFRCTNPLTLFDIECGIPCLQPQ